MSSANLPYSGPKTYPTKPAPSSNIAIPPEIPYSGNAVYPTKPAPIKPLPNLFEENANEIGFGDENQEFDGYLE